MDELRLALRRLARRPGASIVSILTLACAIGAAAATWSLLDAVLVHPLPVKDADRLVIPGRVTTIARQAPAVYDGFDYPSLALYRASGIFEAVAAEWMSRESLLTATPAASTPVRTAIGFATYDFFSVLGVSVARGRDFTIDDDRRGAPPVAILTERYWQREFDGRADAIGRTIAIAGRPVTIVGVAPAGFGGLDLSRPAEMYLPLHTIADVARGSSINYFAEPSHPSSPTSAVRMVARLRAGTHLAQATSALSALDATPPGRARPVYALTPINLSAIPVQARAGMRQFARLLATTVGLLLLIGCGTVGMLLLVRTESRREELSLCLALGASRARLALGIAIEGAVLSVAGALSALPVASWLFAGIASFRLPGNIDIARLPLAIDARALAVTAAAALLASLVISLIAATFGLTSSTSESLRARCGATPRLTRRRTRTALVVAQVAVSVVLAAGAALFARSLAAALRLNTALDMRHIVTGTVDLRPYGYAAARANAFFDDMERRLRDSPAVQSVASSVSLGGMGGTLPVDGMPRKFPTDVGFTAVNDDYFPTMRIRVVEGRGFTDADGPGAPLVTIVSESFARQLAQGGSAIGRRIEMPSGRPGKPRDVVEVVGVVGDVIGRVSVLEPLDMYFPLAQGQPALIRTLTVRAGGDGDAARREIMRAIKAVDQAVAPSALLTLEERIGLQMAPQRFGATVLGALGGIALLLTILGTYVLGESMAALRMREMGIRAALGATRRQLGSIVMIETGRLVGLGLAAGLGLAWIGAGTIRAFLFQIQPFDPLTLGGVAASILSLALLVSLRPALRAARVDLASVLKDA
jgi:predicted permease